MAETPSVYFPDESVEFGFTFGLSFNTIETRLSNRRRQARLLDPRPQRTLEGRIPEIKWDESETIRNFITARGGNFEPFYIFAWMRQKITGYAVGIGDGVDKTFEIPFITAQVPTIYLDGSPITLLSGDYSVTVTGTGGENSIVIAPDVDPPGVGVVITADVIGRERIPVVLNGPVLHVEHPLHRPQDAPGPADFYSIPVIEVF
jgi:hypothetical protein